MDRVEQFEMMVGTAVVDEEPDEGETTIVGSIDVIGHSFEFTTIISFDPTDYHFNSIITVLTDIVKIGSVTAVNAPAFTMVFDSPFFRAPMIIEAEPRLRENPIDDREGLFRFCESWRLLWVR